MMAIELHNCAECRLTQYEQFRADGLAPGEAQALVMQLAEDQP